MKRIEVHLATGDGDCRVGKKEANEGLGRIRSAVGGWRDVATRLGLPRHEQEQMAVCFERE